MRDWFRVRVCFRVRVRVYGFLVRVYCLVVGFRG